MTRIEELKIMKELLLRILIEEGSTLEERMRSVFCKILCEIPKEKDYD